jgi:hypothetical protein
MNHNPSHRPIHPGTEVRDEDLRHVVRTVVTGRVPRVNLARYASVNRLPELGDVLLAEVEQIGDDDRIEQAAIPWHDPDHAGIVPYVQALPCFATVPLTPGRWVLGTIGGRYALDYMLAEVPTQILPRLDLLTFGGVMGNVVARNTRLGPLATVRPVAYFGDESGGIVNTRAFRPAVSYVPKVTAELPLVIVTGGSMESGKTTAAKAVVQGLSMTGQQVFAAKVTGCGSFRDPHRIASGGAVGTTEFMAFGFPSTHGLRASDLFDLFWGTVQLLAEVPPQPAAKPRWLVIELADGLAQPETRCLLQDANIQRATRRIVYAAPDPVSAAGGVGILQKWGWPTPIISGPVASSRLGRQEVCWLAADNHLVFLDAIAGYSDQDSVWREFA